jgi:hypothetical protein
MEKESIRNPISGTCEECMRKVIWAKDDDPGIQSVEYGPGDLRNVCEKCADERLDYERSLR